MTRRTLLLGMAAAPVAVAVAPQALTSSIPAMPEAWQMGVDLASEPSVMIRQVWKRVGDQWRCDAFIGYGNPATFKPFESRMEPPFVLIDSARIRTRFDPARLPA